MKGIVGTLRPVVLRTAWLWAVAAVAVACLPGCRSYCCARATCESCPAVRSVQAGAVHHVVVCWLKEPGNEAQRARLVEVSRSFASIPGVLNVRAGRALPSERTIVDSSFDMAVILSFRNAEAMRLYLDSPAHVEAVRTVLAPLARKIVAYDIVE